MKHFLITIVLLICSAPTLIVGAEIETDFRNKLENFSRAYFSDRESDERFYSELRYQPELFVFYDNLSVFLEADIRFDNVGRSRGIADSFENEVHRLNLDLSEGWAEYGQDLFTVKAGKQIIDWSVTDTVSPSDNISSRDWIDFVRWERVAVPAVDLRVGNNWYGEVVYLPAFSPSRLPAGYFQSTPPVSDDYSKDSSLSYGQSAIRVGGNIYETDLAATFFDGYSYNPVVRLTPQMELEPLYYRERVFSFSVVREFAGLMLRSDVGYYDQDVGDDFLLGVIGAEKNFSQLLTNEDSLFLLFQYCDEAILNERKTMGIDFRRGLAKAAMAKVSYMPTSDMRWELSAETSYNLAYKDWLAKSAVIYNRDFWSCEAGLAMLGGPRDSFFGRYRKNDYMYLRLKLNF